MDEIDSPAKRKKANNLTGTFGAAVAPRGSEGMGIHLEDQDKFEKSDKVPYTPVKDSQYEDSLIGGSQAEPEGEY